MKSYEEIARGALARAEEEKRKQKRRLGAVISVFAVCAAVAAAVLIPQLPRHVKTNGQDETVPDTVAYALGQDEITADYLAAYLKNAEHAPEADPAVKKAKTKAYVDGLFSNGGPAVDQFKKLFGAETARDIFEGYVFSCR